MSKRIQVRNVPDELHRTLRVRAAQAGLSLSDYLLKQLRRGPAWRGVASRIASEDAEVHAQHPHDLFLPRIWELRARVTAYDVAHLALAEALAAPLLTLDRRLARVGGHRARIEIPA